MEMLQYNLSLFPPRYVRERIRSIAEERKVDLWDVLMLATRKNQLRGARLIAEAILARDRQEGASEEELKSIRVMIADYARRLN